MLSLPGGGSGGDVLSSMAIHHPQFFTAPLLSQDLIVVQFMQAHMGHHNPHLQQGNRGTEGVSPTARWQQGWGCNPMEQTLPPSCFCPLGMKLEAWWRSYPLWTDSENPSSCLQANHRTGDCRRESTSPGPKPAPQHSGCSPWPLNVLLTSRRLQLDLGSAPITVCPSTFPGWEQSPASVLSTENGVLDILQLLW